MQIERAPIMAKTAKSTAVRRNPIGRRLIQSTVALLALTAFAAPASATRFQQLLSGKCVGTTCKTDFIKVPSGQRLEINNASCYLRMGVASGGEIILYPPMVATQLLVLGATSPPKVVNAVTLVTSVTGVHEDQAVISSNDTVSAFATAQQHFQVVATIYEGTVFETSCSISGNLLKAV